LDDGDHDRDEQPANNDPGQRHNHCEETALVFSVPFKSSPGDLGLKDFIFRIGGRLTLGGLAVPADTPNGLDSPRRNEQHSTWMLAGFQGWSMRLSSEQAVDDRLLQPLSHGDRANRAGPQR
jgi:hypothetical protein